MGTARSTGPINAGVDQGSVLHVIPTALSSIRKRKRSRSAIVWGGQKHDVQDRRQPV